MVLTGNVAGDIAKADLTAIAEVHAGFAGGGVESDEARIKCGFKDAAAAGLPFRASWIQPGGDTATDEAIAIISSEFNHGIEDPELLACFRIDGKDAIEGGGEVERAIHKNGGCFEAAALLAVAAVGNIADMGSPGNLQIGHIVAIDLGERRITHATGVVTVVGPVIGG